MTQRIGFRRLLPFVFTLMHIVILLYGMERQGQARAFGALEQRYVPAVYQENAVRWDPTIEPKPLTAAQKLGLLLNLPSLLLAIPLAVTVFRGSDMGLLYAALPFVPLVWYGIGRWMDTTLGIREATTTIAAISEWLSCGDCNRFACDKRHGCYADESPAKTRHILDRNGLDYVVGPLSRNVPHEFLSSSFLVGVTRCAQNPPRSV